MAHCITCNKKLGFLNTPMFNKGQTSEGGTICTSCHMALATKGFTDIASKLKQYKNEEVIEAIQKINKSKEELKTGKKIAQEKSNEKLQIIKAKIQSLNPGLVSKREVAELPSILMEDEIIEKVNNGFLDEGKGTTGNGLIIATNLRVIFIDKPLVGFGIKMEDFPYDKITSVSVETGFLKGILKIICSGNTAKINLITGAKDFSEFVRQKTLAKPMVQVINAQPNILEQIEKLAELKEKGILSQEEFDAKKVELLSKL